MSQFASFTLNRVADIAPSATKFAEIQPLIVQNPTFDFLFNALLPVFCMVLLFGGVPASLLTLGMLFPWRKGLSRKHFVWIVVGGAFAFALSISSFYFIANELPKSWFTPTSKEKFILTVGVILQIAYTLGSYQLFKTKSTTF